MLEAQIGFNRQHDSGATRKVRKDARRLGQRSLEAAALSCSANLGVNPRPILPTKVAEIEQCIHKKPQTVLRRKASRARVRRVDQTKLLQVLHDVADRSWGQRNR